MCCWLFFLTRLMDCDLDRLVRGLANFVLLEPFRAQLFGIIGFCSCGAGRGAPLEESVAKRFCAQALDSDKKP